MYSWFNPLDSRLPCRLTQLLRLDQRRACCLAWIFLQKTQEKATYGRINAVCFQLLCRWSERTRLDPREPMCSISEQRCD